MEESATDFSVTALLTKNSEATDDPHRASSSSSSNDEQIAMINQFYHNLYLQAISSLFGGITTSNGFPARSEPSFQANTTFGKSTCRNDRYHTPSNTKHLLLNPMNHGPISISNSATTTARLERDGYSVMFSSPSLDLPNGSIGSPRRDQCSSFDYPPQGPNGFLERFETQAKHFRSNGGLALLLPSTTASTSRIEGISRWSPTTSSKSSESSKSFKSGTQRRVVFTEQQRRELESAFNENEYITKQDRRKLADGLGLKDCQVKIWFQNRRMKWRSTESQKQQPEKLVTEKVIADENNYCIVLGKGKETPRSTSLNKSSMQSFIKCPGERRTKHQYS